MLYVILAGLGLTLLVRSVGQVIEARSRIQLYWIHTSWIGFIFIAHVTSWFEFWDFRHVESWNAARFLLALSIPTTLYLISHISVPEIYGDDRNYNFREYFYQRNRTILGLMSAVLVLNLTCELLLLGEFQIVDAHVLRLVILVTLITGMISNHPRLHAIVTVVMYLAFLIGLTLLGEPLS
jgi:hypothetical protein